VSAYFERLDHAAFRATSAVQGAWNTAEQHVAPALGLVTHAIEQDRDARRVDDLRVARLSFDILGTLPIDVVEIEVRVVRAGRTIELVEGTLSHDGRAAVLRAWLLAPSDTASIAGSHFPSIPAPDRLEPWDAEGLWPGEFVRTVDARRAEAAPGRARFWLRPRVPLLENEPVSSTAGALSILDIANGITPLHPPTSVGFPNLDTTVHLFTEPRGEWLGFDTTVTFGPGDIGVVVCGKRRAFVERSDGAFLEEVRKYYVALDVVADLRSVSHEPIKLAVFDFGDAATSIAPALSSIAETDQVVVSGPHWVDVMARGANKGVALSALQEELGVTREQTAAFGDYLNDLEMLEAAGLSFAMENAHPDITLAARFQAPHHEAGGVITVLSEILSL